MMGQPTDAYDLVTDRPGHDMRYAIDWSKLRDELGWAPDLPRLRRRHSPTRSTWYRDNEAWWRPQKAEAEAKYAAVGAVTSWSTASRSPLTRRRSPGLTLFDIPVHGDNRGWFKENWQREKMVALGLPDFGPVQNNISFNRNVGTTRGIHAEPWDKFISVATGRVFGAWVDLRAGEGSVRSSPPRSTRPRRSSCRAASATRFRPSRPTPPTPIS